MMKVLVLQALLVAARWQPRVVQKQAPEPDTRAAYEVQRRLLPWLVTQAMPATAAFQVPVRSSVPALSKEVTISVRPRMMADPPEEDKLGSLLRSAQDKLGPALKNAQEKLGPALKSAQDKLGSVLEDVLTDSTLEKPAEATAVAPADPAAPAKSGGLPFFLDVGTKGGVVFYSLVGLALPFWGYQFMLDELKFDVVLAGNVILVGYVGLATVAWTGSYVFRVANKDMTYAQQLKDYENAVIQKRFEELSDGEVDALMGEIYQAPRGAPSAESPEEEVAKRAAAAAAEELAAAVGRMEGAGAGDEGEAAQAAAESAVKLQDAVDRQKAEGEQ